MTLTTTSIINITIMPNEAITMPANIANKSARRKESKLVWDVLIVVIPLRECLVLSMAAVELRSSMRSKEAERERNEGVGSVLGSDQVWFMTLRCFKVERERKERCSFTRNEQGHFLASVITQEELAH